MNKKTKKKNMLFRIIAAIVAFVIIGGILFVANAFVGNPINSTIAKNKVQKYVQVVYSNNNKIDNITYDWYNRYYLSTIIINNKETKFKFRSNLITDENVTNFYQQRFDNDYSIACNSFADSSYLQFPVKINISTVVEATGHYNTNFDKLPVQQKIWLMEIKNTDKNIKEDVSKKMAGNIAKKLIDELGNKYNFTSIQAMYFDKFGGYEIMISNTNNITIDKLYNNTIKMNSVGEEEKAFIDGLNK